MRAKVMAGKPGERFYVGEKQTTIRFGLPLDGYIEVGADGTLERIYLELSTRRDMESVVDRHTGKEPGAYERPGRQGNFTGRATGITIDPISWPRCAKPSC